MGRRPVTSRKPHAPRPFAPFPPVRAVPAGGVPAFAQSVAITFDDGPSLAATPRLGAGERNTALLRALAQHFYNSHRLHPVLGKLPPSVYERTMAAKEAIAVSEIT
jgi:hypothetical protein